MGHKTIGGGAVGPEIHRVHELNFFNVLPPTSLVHGLQSHIEPRTEAKLLSDHQVHVVDSQPLCDQMAPITGPLARPKSSEMPGFVEQLGGRRIDNAGRKVNKLLTRIVTL